MKTFALTLSLILCLNAWAQSLDESTSGSLDTAFAETAQLTDQQATQAAEFVHQGLKDKAIQEGCDNKTLKGCDGSSARPGLEDQIGKMYAVIFGLAPMLGGGKSKNSNDGNNAGNGNPPAGDNASTAQSGSQTGQQAKEKNKKDYCIYIPLAYEGLSFLIQSAGQKNAAQETANLDPQLASLAQLKEAHKTRKKTATQQSVVYGTTAACYAGMLLTGNISGGAMTYVKMGAAGALSMLYMSKAKKHANAAKKVQGVIDSLPKAGDCNPWTGTQCFCSEKTSATLYPGQYNEVCVLNKGNFDGPLSNLGCAVSVGGQVTLDESCSCKNNNTCLSTKISLGKSNLGLGANFVNDANKGLQLLDPSQFDEARLNDFASAMAGKIAKIKPKEPIPDVKLTPAQKALADEMSKVAPASVANIAATAPSAAPPSGGLMASSTSGGLDKIPPQLRKELSDFQVSGKYKSNVGYSTTADSADPGFSIPGLGPQEPQGGIQVEEEFAAKAIGNADVRNAPETALFDIISNRYRASAWKRLDTEGK